MLLIGILFANGRRTVTTWLRAAGISDDFDDYYYFLAAVGCKTESIATPLVLLLLRVLPLPVRLLLVIDDCDNSVTGNLYQFSDRRRVECGIGVKSPIRIARCQP